MQHIGILGGTFDPIHYGHLAIAEEVRWALTLSFVYLIPAAQQPLKPGMHAATPHQRLDMVRLACQENAALVPSAIELQRSPPSFTIDTLRELHKQHHTTADLWFIIGSDSLASLPRWHAIHDIISLAKLAVLARPGYATDIAMLEEAIPGITSRAKNIAGPHLTIASSTLRQRIAAGQPVRYQIPDKVLEYITTHGLYQ